LQDTDIRWAAFYSPSAKKATGTSPVWSQRVGRSLQMSLAQSTLQMQTSVTSGIPPGVSMPVPQNTQSAASLLPAALPSSCYDLKGKLRLQRKAKTWGR
jgi:hypothetical protein